MAGVPDYMKRVVGWDRTTTQVADRAELAHLVTHSAQLEGFSQQYKDKSAEYATLSARKLELMQEIQDLFRQGEAAVYFIRTGVRAHYGNGSDQLVAFGLVPTTRRARRTTTPPVEAPAEPVPVPDPAK
jgi:hypothetical protein